MIMPFRFSLTRTSKFFIILCKTLLLIFISFRGISKPLHNYMFEKNISEQEELSVTLTNVITNNRSPALSGTINDMGATIRITIDGNEYDVLNNQEGTWKLDENTIDPPLSEGSYDIIITLTNIDNGSDLAFTKKIMDGIIIDLTPPVMDFIITTTNETSPLLQGTIDDTTAALEIMILGVMYTPVNHGDGTWSLSAGQINALDEGSYNITISANDEVGNEFTKTVTNGLVIDLTPPVMDFIITTTHETSPLLQGTIDDTTAALEIMILGVMYTPVNHGDGTWSLSAGQINALDEGSYNITISANDEAGNEFTKTVTNGLMIDLTPPIMDFIITTTHEVSPLLQGTIDDTTAALEIMILGVMYTPVNHGDGTWSLSAGQIDVLDEGSYNITISANDKAGNEFTKTVTNGLIIESTPILSISATDASNITPFSFEANWNMVTNKSEYLLDVSRSSDFSSFVTGYQNKSVTTSSHEVTGLDFGTHYYYRVRVVNTSNETSDYSDTINVMTTIDPMTMADFEVLKSIYNATGGSNAWNNQGNWLSDRFQNWNFIEITNGRVTSINLQNNNLVGTFPNIEGLDKLQSIDISNNNLENIPNFSTLRSLENLNVSNNVLEFDDLLPVVTSNEISSINYSNQKRLMFQETTNGETIKKHIGAQFTLSVLTGGNNNQYRWFRNGEHVSTIQGNVLRISAINYENMGEYYVEVTHPNVPNLTLNVQPQNLLATANVTINVVGENELPITDPIINEYLFEIKTSEAYDTLNFNLGQVSSNFTLQDIVLSDYLALVESDPEQFISTYYGDAFYWEDADTLLLRSDTTIQISITQKPRTLTQNDGSGKIKGLIEQIIDDGESESSRVFRRRRIRARRRCGLRRARAFLRTFEEFDNYELVVYGESNENGEFEFGNIPNGTYYFFVEHPGIPLRASSFQEIVIENGSNKFTLLATIHEDEIEVEIAKGIEGEEENPKKILGDPLVYPNPVNQQVIIQYEKFVKKENLEKKFIVNLINFFGEIVWQKTYSEINIKNIQINTSTIERGSYILYFYYDEGKKKKDIHSFRIFVDH